ncbi:hypothetical protein [Methanosarcina vacuolata]|uniref:Uncharacterized protein n=1 Tax=Methanosarcina vacuolata Z-761 TaxID=1434123 RepID=A0A0E3LHH0_9EURY|nr:hypothetical protein [Methanosarcina vacuolata]AKB44256.1 hypothetical protein MSVAZ_1987 [Methanosarcina vacuolata Z-761]
MRTLIFILTIFTIFSGCVEESNVTQSNESAYQGSGNTTPENQSSTTLSSEEENIPEIEVTSFSSIYMHDNSENVLSYLFSWDNVPGNESNNLSKYLKNDLEIDWISNAQIIKTNDNNTIRVFTPDNSLELKLADDKNTVLIIPNNIQLKVKQENGRLCIYRVKEYRGSSDPAEVKLGYNLNEKYYAAYDLSIKNNGSNDLDFRLNKLHVRDGNRTFNTTNLDPYGFYERSHLEVLSSLKEENKIENITLSPGQTINGSVVFQVNSLYNESFLLMYNETPVSSASLEKSIEALRVAERFNYSTVFGIPPYSEDPSELNSEGTPLFCSWVNRSVFEFFNKADPENVMEPSLYSPDEISWTKIVYALEVKPEKNITTLPVKNRDSHTYSLLVVDDAGEELINTHEIEKIAFLRNGTYQHYSRNSQDVPQMNLTNHTFVRTSFERTYGTPMNVYVSINNQNLILDDDLNAILVRYSDGGYHFV